MGSKNVLVIEDDPDQAYAMRIYLTANRFDVDIAEDAASAFVLLAKKLPDVIVMDVGLPVHNGFEILHTLKKMNPYTKIPVIVVTARDDKEAYEDALNGGANAFFKKPFIYKDLVRSVKQYCQP